MSGKEAACLDNLYAVFARYPRKPLAEMDTCPCCRASKLAQIAPLFSVPLREAPAEPLAYFAFCALTTIGEVDDLRHFLPRILALLEEPEFEVGCDAEVVLGKLRLAQWEMWPEVEQAAIRDYLVGYQWSASGA